MKHLTFILMLIIAQNGRTQVLSGDRSVNWQLAGLNSSFSYPSTQLDVSLHGLSGDGQTNNDLTFSSLTDSLAGQSVIFYFPSGSYLFNSPIKLKANHFLKGASNDSTTLLFDLISEDHAIKIAGYPSQDSAYLKSDAPKGASFLMVDKPELFNPGKYIHLSQSDEDRVVSSWAKRTTGQLIRIDSINENKLYLASAPRDDYKISKNAACVLINVVENTGISRLKIKRLDDTEGQMSNVYIGYAANCQISCIESEQCNYAHIEGFYATNMEVKGSYFHHAFGYGGGGQAYGVMLHFSSGECLIEGNLFERLRHSMIVQAGANGNVFGYNYSRDPYWTGTLLPANSAGDLVLHGNYPYANLFEGNVVQNLVIDNSHGINGPHNTLFRNRVQLWGITMNSNPASDSQNFIGNEITNSGFLMGNYSLAGSDHFEYGNNLRGQVRPSGTDDLEDATYYCTEIPSFYTEISSWPPIGFPQSLNEYTNETEDRYLTGVTTSCGQAISVSLSELVFDVKVYPNPFHNQLFVESDAAFDQFAIYDLQGHLVSSGIFSQVIDFSVFDKGNYILRLSGKSESVVVKVVSL